MLSTINSTSPRVFRSAPRASELRHDCPVQRTAAVAPPIFPRVAAMRTMAAQSHMVGLFQQIEARTHASQGKEKRQQQNGETSISSRPRIVCCQELAQGKHIPARNAPN